jgi:alpha-tubulin suppressor-like RCC1 family protein
VLALTGDRFVKVAAGSRHSCALDASGRAFCWGYAREGQLGDSGAVFPESSSPVAVAGNRQFTDLVPLDGAMCGLTATSVAYCWGGYGIYLGTGSASNTYPRAILGGFAWANLAGGAFLCGTSIGGPSMCWGDAPGGNSSASRLGDGTRQSRTVPTPIAGSPQFADISAGDQMACALSQSGEAWCWGAGGVGQLGTGSYTTASVPVRVLTSLRFTEVHAAYSHTCALTADGQAWCWGEGRQGQLGHGLAETSPLPVKVSQGSEVFVSISMSGSHTCAIGATRRVYCWGDNSYGALGFPGGRSLIPLPVSRPEP